MYLVNLNIFSTMSSVSGLGINVSLVKNSESQKTLLVRYATGLPKDLLLINL